MKESRIEARTVVIKQAELPRPKENEFVNEEKYGTRFFEDSLSLLREQHEKKIIIEKSLHALQ